MTDLTFDFGDLPPPPVEEPAIDTVADALVEKGLVPNTFILDLNKGLTVPYDMELPYPWSLPSRLFQFPIEVSEQDDDGTRKIGLLHPLLAYHPFVQQVEAAMGMKIDPNGAPNEFGYTKAPTGQWWHAVDLVSSGHWRELIDTKQFTTSENIANAVGYGLQYSRHDSKRRNGYISTAEAREIMAEIDAPEPEDRDAAIRESFWTPSCCKSEKGTERWPINSNKGDGPFVNAWAHILGIEAGYFVHDRAGFLGWTPLGRDRFPVAERVVSQETAARVQTEEPEAVTADEIAPRPIPAMTAQLALF